MIVAADLGSTNMKVALFAEDGTRVAEASRPLPYEIHTNISAELSPDAVRECFLGLLADLRSGESVRKIRRVSFTSQAQTFCITDARGCPRSKFFGWADVRGGAEASQLQRVLGESFHRECGWPSVSPTHMISKVLWWRKTHGLSEDDRVVSLPSFLAMQLGAAHASDTNLAAMSGFYSIPGGGWWNQAIEAVGVRSSQLGDLVAPGDVLSRIGPPGCPDLADDFEVVMAGNDHTAGAVGCGCRPGRSILTLGTAGVIYRHAGEMPGPYSQSGLWGPYPGGGYYELLCLDHACSALDWADGFLFGNVDSLRFVARARRGNARESSPLFDPGAWGSAAAWVGEGTEEEKAYATLEGIVFALRALAGDGFSGGGEEIVILGGGSRLDFWVQLVANIFRRPIIRGSNDGLAGAAALAGIPIVEPRRASEVFLPDPATFQSLEARFVGWNAVFP